MLFLINFLSKKRIMYEFVNSGINITYLYTSVDCVHTVYLRVVSFVSTCQPFDSIQWSRSLSHGISENTIL